MYDPKVSQFEHTTGRIAILAAATVIMVVAITIGYVHTPDKPPQDPENAITELGRSQEYWFLGAWANAMPKDKELLLKYRELLLEDQCMRLNAHLAFMDKKNGQEPKPIKLPKNKEEVAERVNLHKP